MKKIVYLLLTASFLWSCDSGKSTEKAEDFENDSSSVSNSSVPKELMEEIMRSIPSPVEIASLIKNSGADYSPDILNSTDNLDNYNTNYKKAINLGIYGADLGYINMYEKNTDAVAYLTSVKRLADDLRIGQFFDFNTLKRLASNKQNLDSLLYISNKGFANMDNYLREQNRANISVMILMGGWLEGLHLATKISQQKDNPKLDERIGEQKISVDQLVMILAAYEKDKNLQLLLADLKELKAIYDTIEIVYTEGEATMEEVNGVLMVVDNSTSTVKISKEEIKKISAILDKTRSRLTK
jgi:hypothetical protein